MKCVYIVRERSKPPFKYVYEHCYKIGMSDHWSTRRKYYVSHGYEILWIFPVTHPRILEGALKCILCNLACSDQNTEVFCFPRGYRSLARLINKTWKELRKFIHQEYGSRLDRKDDDTTRTIERWQRQHRSRFKWLQTKRIYRHMAIRMRP